MPREVRYARSGDVSIAYQVIADGPFDLAWTPGALSRRDLEWEDEDKARFLRGLAAFSRLIVFDKRGTGLSDRVAGIADLETRMDDIRTVMDAAGSETAVICGEAGPGEVLVSQTVKDLVAGSGIEFEDRGGAELKGLPGEWTLYAVADAT